MMTYFREKIQSTFTRTPGKTILLIQVQYNSNRNICEQIRRDRNKWPTVIMLP